MSNSRCDHESKNLLGAGAARPAGETHDHWPRPSHGQSCCSAGVPVFDGMDHRYKRVLWTVIGINGAMFLTGMIGSACRFAGAEADALDFLADTVTYGLSLAVSAQVSTRATAALFKGLSLSLMALWVFGSTVYQTLILGYRARRSWASSASWRLPPILPRSAS